MNLTEIILAAALISGSAAADKEQLVSLRFQHPTLRTTLRGVALQWELLDPREAEYRFVEDDDLTDDLAMVRRRFEELRDAPRISDGYRFPDREYAVAALRFNRAYQADLEERLGMYSGAESRVRKQLLEVERLQRIWEIASEIRRECLYLTARRLALLELRNLIGAQAFDEGRLPVHVPIEWFEVVK